MSLIIESLSRVVASYPSRFVLGCGALSGAVALEMTIRAVRDLCAPRRIWDPEPSREDLGKNVGGALFYGLCAFNVFPYAPVVGASVFVAYSISSFYYSRSEDPYIFAQIIGSTFDIVIVRGLGQRVISPICEHILEPLAQAIYHVVAPIFRLLPISHHPIWIGVAAIVVTAVAYNVFVAGLPFTLTCL